MSPIRKWWNRNFSKRPPINEDWRVGDKAVCVEAKWLLPYHVRCPEKGGVYLVERVKKGNFNVTGEKGWALTLCGLGHNWDAFGFRKITPSSEEFAKRIRRCKPIRVKEPIA